ncbi:MAG: DUF58 domain-containing protein [Myxococcales bacterium]|nr:DUF58 domain-containing protein [Myxococcales bacterium]
MSNQPTNLQIRNTFDEEFLKRLEKLHIMAQKVYAGQNRAERRSKKIGSGIEYADHRDYAPGDDIRYLDWNVFGRTEKMLVRLYEEEEDISVYVLVDVSNSMMMGQPPKLEYAYKVTAALSYISLSNLDRVSVIPFAEHVTAPMSPVRGKGQIFKVFDFLSQTTIGGATNSKEAFRSFVHRYKRRGPAIVISDMYEEQGFAESLNVLRYYKFDPMVIHIWDEAELNPNLRGDLKLIDCESGRSREVTITRALVDKYRKAHALFMEESENICRTRQIPYFRASIQTPFDDLVLQIFRRGGVVA